MITQNRFSHLASDEQTPDGHRPGTDNSAFDCSLEAVTRFAAANGATG